MEGKNFGGTNLGRGEGLGVKILEQLKILDFQQFLSSVIEEDLALFTMVTFVL